MARASAPSPTEAGGVEPLLTPEQALLASSRVAGAAGEAYRRCAALRIFAAQLAHVRSVAALSPLGCNRSLSQSTELRTLIALAPSSTSNGTALAEALIRSMAPDSLETREQRTCTDCGAHAPSTGSNYTLISASHGWRFASRPGRPGEKPLLQWRCPGCWAAYRTAGGKLRPTP